MDVNTFIVTLTQSPGLSISSLAIYAPATGVVNATTIRLHFHTAKIGWEQEHERLDSWTENFVSERIGRVNLSHYPASHWYLSRELVLVPKRNEKRLKKEERKRRIHWTNLQRRRNQMCCFNLIISEKLVRIFSFSNFLSLFSILSACT